jgi:hypothetical protein
MAHVNDNDVTLGLRGKFGKQFVFRKFGRKTIAARAASSTGRQTDAQHEHRERFRLATVYAKRSLLQPELKAEYEAIARAKQTTTPFAAAVGDFLKPVEINGILTASYHGEAGFPLTIMVNDLFKVKTMKVTFTNASGGVVESGLATRTAESAGYTYVTTVAIPDVSGLNIKVEVTDRPGNLVMDDVTL